MNKSLNLSELGAVWDSVWVQGHICIRTQAGSLEEMQSTLDIAKKKGLGDDSGC